MILEEPRRHESRRGAFGFVIFQTRIGSPITERERKEEIHSCSREEEEEEYVGALLFCINAK